ncbi:unnamed protein product [Clonostachys solani]|uniref:Serum paraoxonase/arylesterase 1 n=1 Tax=Clonostachys solani TaxID=160281 RepID=A0A9N9Z0K3_9HYPO|nr:unnamed protein product [Clonostachys solani]
MALRLPIAIFAVALAALFAWVRDRSNALSIFYANHPDRLVRINTSKSYEIKFQDRVRNCEDAFLLKEQGLAILACDPGRDKWNTVMGVFHPGQIPQAELYIYNYAAKNLDDDKILKKLELVNFPEGLNFHTVGFGYHEESSHLFVTNHARTGPRIEQFKLDIRSLKATHILSILHPQLISPNAIIPLSAEELLVTNDHYFTAKQSKPLYLMESYLGPALAPLLYINLKNIDKGNAKVLARVPYPNGMGFINSTTLAIASTSRGSVYFYSMTKDQHNLPKLQYQSRIRLPFLPDNLAVEDGKLLIGGQPHPPSMAKYVSIRHICNFPDTLQGATEEMKDACNSWSATSWAAEWSEADGLKDVYAGTEYPTSSTFVRDSKRNVAIIVGLYARGIMVLHE